MLLLAVTCVRTSRLDLHERMVSFEKRNPVHYCGKDLADMLDLLCLGGAGKRSSPDLIAEESATTLSRDFLLPSLRSAYEIQRRLSSRGQRRKRGIVEECCERPCSISVMREFC
ncbi:bombyxin B-6-like [Amphibalanus amphitrite]|uniref:bombyxin B-6-like n=1 Tax=Amphibalanus amphitrite TaxID=1232801 RepID=UPI001C928BB8|nr:bombyxin B-6-like [Amphibalanus amphitrite]